MLDKNIPISQIMSTDIISVNQFEKLSHVAFLFQTNDLHHLPVIDDEQKVIGIISTSDYYKTLHNFTLFREGHCKEVNERFLESRYVTEIMTKNVVKLNPEDKLEVAVCIFAENLFHALPVVDKWGKLEGIITTFDLINYAYNDQFQLND